MVNNLCHFQAKNGNFIIPHLAHSVVVSLVCNHSLVIYGGDEGFLNWQ